MALPCYGEGGDDEGLRRCRRPGINAICHHLEAPVYRINVYLSFNGDCAAAFRFYQQLFGAPEPMAMTYGGSPVADQMPPQTHGKVMHAALDIGTATLMGADAISDLPDHPEYAYTKPQGITVAINVEQPAEADRLFAALSQGGTVQMPMDETFWARRFGMCTDRFGIPWMINCSRPHG